MDIHFDRYTDVNGKEQTQDHAFVINKLLTIPQSYDSVVAALFIRDHYETYYGISNHQAGVKKDVIPMIAYSEVEDTFETSFLRERMTKYRKSGVLAVFGLSWDKFMLQPKYINDAMIEEAEFAMQEKAREAAVLAEGLNNGTIK